MKIRELKLLDFTTDGGKTYEVAGIYTSEFRVKKAVKAFFDRYNDERDKEKGEVEFEYRDDLWQHIENNALVLPFGPGAEFRVRQIVPNALLSPKK